MRHCKRCESSSPKKKKPTKVLSIGDFYIHDCVDDGGMINTASQVGGHSRHLLLSGQTHWDKQDHRLLKFSSMMMHDSQQRDIQTANYILLSSREHTVERNLNKTYIRDNKNTKLNLFFLIPIKSHECIIITLMSSCGSVVEHCVSSAKGCGFNSQGTHVLTINV